MIITLFSRHVSKSSIPDEGAGVICRDLVEFNCMKRRAYAMNRKDPAKASRRKSAKPAGSPDLRKKENAALLAELPLSTHVLLKQEFDTSDYFVNSAENEAKAVLSAVLELRAGYIKEQTDTLSQIRSKIRQKESRLAELEKTKACLVALSKLEKFHHGRKPTLRMPKGGVETVNNKGVFSISHFNKKKHKRRTIAAYQNAYLFETQYLDPKIASIKRVIHLLKGRAERVAHGIDRLKEEPSVCFGGKDLFRKRNTVYAGKPDVWRSVYRKRRSRRLAVSGRKDSKNGNFVFSYNPATKELTYKSMHGRVIVIPDVVFPYGQSWLEKYVSLQMDKKACPIAWAIEETGGSFIIKCSFERNFILDKDAFRVNDYYGDGCIGIDTNVDCFAVAETDRYGNLVSHTVVPFDLTYLSSGAAEQVLSLALDKVFLIAKEKKKPIAAEDLQNVSSKDIYGSRSRNRKISSFAYGKVRQLLMSKSWKYGIYVAFVPPQYTSLSGKVKYMARYGISIHESAAYTIARRGMGLTERLPPSMWTRLPAEKKARHFWSH